MKKWQKQISEETATKGKARGLMNGILPGRKKFAEDEARLATLMAYAAEKVKPAAEVKERLMARLDEAHKNEKSFVVAEGDRSWKTIFPGVKECELARGDGRQSRLLKIRKGFFLPPHRHREIEEAFILEGRCYSGKVLLQKGDYFFAHANTKHATVKAIEDCLILLIAHQ